MTGLADLLQSERGVFALGVLLAATILAALRVIDGAMWMGLVKYLSVVLIAGKTVTTAVQAHVDGRVKEPDPLPQATVVKS